jgi:hypothetical protein
MPNVNKKLLATYLAHHLGVMSHLWVPDSGNDTDTLIFNFKNKDDADKAFASIQSLLLTVQADIEKAQIPKQEVTRLGKQISVPDSHVSIKFIADLKALVVSVLSKEDPRNFDPRDFSENNYDFCEQIEDYYSLPAMHKNIAAGIENKFLRIGIRLCTISSRHQHLFSSHSDYRSKEISFTTGSFEMGKFVAAKFALDTPKPEPLPAAVPATPGSSSQSSVFFHGPIPPRHNSEEMAKQIWKP